MGEDARAVKGSENIFKDMGLPNPDESLAKARIASMIYDIIESRGLTQKRAGDILGVSQPKISALRNGRLEGFSIERLFSFLRAMDQVFLRTVHLLAFPLFSSTGENSIFQLTE